METVDTKLSMIAYRINAQPEMPLTPAAPERDWMDQTPDRFAYRCLPLLMANQSGWFLRSSHTLRATWNGGSEPHSLRIEYQSGEQPYPCVSHFGGGILTWTLPYLFRTPPGWNLLVRGPANMPKDGVQALEGLVETDWSVAAFTMNWKITRPNHTVTFSEGEPIAMLVPQRRNEMEAFAPEERRLADEPELLSDYRRWSVGRMQFLMESMIPGADAQKQGWQKDYFRGETPSRHRNEEHQVKRSLAPFLNSGAIKEEMER